MSVWLVFFIIILLSCFVETSENANSVDFDQMPRSAASDLSTLFANVPFIGCKTKMG